MATAENLLALARAELGTVESPANSNRVKYNAAYYGREVSGSSYAWCAVFLWWLFREAGAMTEVNGTIERPRDLVTREELAVVAAALSKK